MQDIYLYWIWVRLLPLHIGLCVNLFYSAECLLRLCIPVYTDCSHFKKYHQINTHQESLNMLHTPCCPRCLSTAGTYSPRLWTGSCSCFWSSPSAPAGCRRWGERSAGGETDCWSCSGNHWSPFWSRPKTGQSPLCISWLKKKKRNETNVLMLNLNIFSYSRGADGETHSTWCRWWAAPSAWCFPCAGR